MTHQISAAFLAVLQIRSNPWSGAIFMYGAIFAVFYFVLLRPGQKQRKEHELTVRSLKKGDEIVTTGGLVGEVLHIREMQPDSKTGGMEDRITVRTGESRVVVERGRIARVVRSTATQPPATTN